MTEQHLEALQAFGRKVVEAGMAGSEDLARLSVKFKVFSEQLATAATAVAEVVDRLTETESQEPTRQEMTDYIVDSLERARGDTWMVDRWRAGRPEYDGTGPVGDD